MGERAESQAGGAAVPAHTFSAGSPSEGLEEATSTTTTCGDHSEEGSVSEVRLPAATQQAGSDGSEGKVPSSAAMAADAEAASFLLSFARGSKTAPGEGEADPGGTKTEQKAEQKAEDNGDGVPSPPANRPPSGKDHIEDRPEPGALAQPKATPSRGTPTPAKTSTAHTPTTPKSAPASNEKASASARKRQRSTPSKPATLAAAPTGTSGTPPGGSKSAAAKRKRSATPKDAAEKKPKPGAQSLPSRKPSASKPSNIDPFPAACQTLQTTMTQDVQKIMADYRTVLDRTIRYENEAYTTQQYERSAIAAALAQVLDQAKTALKIELGIIDGKKINIASNAGKMAYNKNKRSADLLGMCKAGKAGKVAVLLEEVSGLDIDHFDINCKNSNGQTALHQTIVAGHVEVVKMLLTNEADVSLKSCAAGVPPLHEAAKRNNIDIVRLLIEHGADRNQTSNSDQTVFDFPINLATWSVLENTPGPHDAAQPADAWHATPCAAAAHPTTAAATTRVDLFASQPLKARAQSTSTTKAKSRPALSEADLHESIKLQLKHARAALEFTSSTEFFLGKTVNNAFKSCIRKRVWAKHTELFRHSCSNIEKTFSLDDSGPRTLGLKATVLLADEVRQLAFRHVLYKDKVQVGENINKMVPIQLNDASLESIKAEARQAIAAFRQHLEALDASSAVTAPSLDACSGSQGSAAVASPVEQNVAAH